MTMSIVVLNTSGWDWTLLKPSGQFTDATWQGLLGNHEESLGSVLYPRHKGWIFTGTKELQLNTFTTQVNFWMDTKPVSWRIWKFIPVKVEDAPAPSESLTETLDSGSLPPYGGDVAGQSSTRAQYAESEYDEFGTVVNEVTVVTTTSTVTTRKRYRVEDA